MAPSREEGLQRFMERIEGRVHTFQLPNGLRFAVYPRSEVPIVSCNVTVDVRRSLSLLRTLARM